MNENIHIRSCINVLDVFSLDFISSINLFLLYKACSIYMEKIENYIITVHLVNTVASCLATVFKMKPSELESNAVCFHLSEFQYNIKS